MLPIFETKMLIYRSKTNLHEKILFGTNTRLKHSQMICLIEPEIRESSRIRLVWEPRFHIPFWSMIFLLSNLKFTYEGDNGTESESYCQINRGPEWNMEFSIPIIVY